MNYKKHYTLLLEKHGTREKPEGYSERHHIVPRCLGGGDEEENLIYLSARCHFIAHAMLTRIHPGNHKLLTAYWLMSHLNNNRINSLSYARLRAEIIRLHTGAGHPRAVPVITPLGAFSTTREAAAAHGIRANTVCRRAASDSRLFHDWYYPHSPIRGDKVYGRDNPKPREVTTPKGIFPSCSAADKALKLAAGTTNRKARSDNPMHNGWKFTGKEGSRPETERKARKVRTPLGEFSSIRKAAKAHSVQPRIIELRCKKVSNDDYHFV